MARLVDMGTSVEVPMSRLLSFVLVLSSACAERRPLDDEPVLQQEHALAQAIVHEGDYATAHECADAASAIYVHDKDAGWRVLVQCAARDDFNDLQTLLAEPWTDELRTRREGPALVARVIALRGGNIDRDLRTARRFKQRLFSLRAAVAEPEELTGDLVIMRGSVVGWRRAGGARSVEVNETRPIIDDDFFDDREVLRRRMRNTALSLEELSVETGHTVLVRLPASAVLDPSTDYVLLLRFEGEREAPVGAPGVVGSAYVATVVEAFEPESNLVVPP